jgi:hypothetical protein
VPSRAVRQGLRTRRNSGAGSDQQAALLTANSDANASNPLPPPPPPSASASSPAPPHLAHVVVALLHAQARKAHGRLPAAAVLLGQIHRELVEHVAVVPLHCAVQTAAAVHHDEAELLVVLQHLLQRLRSQGWARTSSERKGSALKSCTCASLVCGHGHDPRPAPAAAPEGTSHAYGGPEGLLIRSPPCGTCCHRGKRTC